MESIPRPRTFGYFPLDTSRVHTNSKESHRSLGWEIDPFVYRIGEGKQQQITQLNNNNTENILQKVCEERGWKEFGVDEERLFKGRIVGWNLWWRNIFSPVNHTSVYSWQYVNYIPRAIKFCNKEYLARYMNLMQSIFGTAFDFCPTTFVLPEEYWKLYTEHVRRSELDEQSLFRWDERARNLVPVEPGYNELESHSTGRAVTPKNFQPVWISKPIGKSQGKGIVVLNNTSSLGLCETSSVVQEYIARPYLIAGHKFDLRLYIFIPSTTPLTVYVYNEGLTRFALEKYDVKKLGNNFSHLTNATINKLSPEYSRDKECLGVGCKWTLQRLREYLKKSGRSDWFMWQRIVSMIVLTLVGESTKSGFIPTHRNCFEFLGYDILLDEDLRPWLLEVNHSPGLNGDCDVDYTVKRPLLHDLFNLLGLPIYGKGTKEVERERRKKKFAKDDNDNVSERSIQWITPKSQRDRLLELTAIYCQKMTPLNLKPKKKSKQRPKCPSSATDDESTPSTGKRRIKMRDWMNPIKKCGGWVRVFPFDDFSHEQTRTKISVDTKLIVHHIHSNLKTARELVVEKPGQSDEVYAEEFKTASKITTEIWIPPC